MDLDIAKSLSELQAKKLAIEAGTDLTGHCDALVELDRRVGNLLDEVRALHTDLEERFGFMEGRLEQLGPSYQTLVKTDEVLDLVIELNRLNRICRRLDSNPNLVHSEDDKKMFVKILPKANCDIENIDLDGDDKSMLLAVLELLDSFEEAYKPLEGILSTRQDLPYLKYATKVRALRDSLVTLRKMVLK